MKQEILLITRNKDKLLAARKAFSQFGIGIKLIDRDYPEIQAMENIDIARYTAVAAAKDFGAPAVREDHGLFIRTLGGFPGPYGNYFERTMTAEMLLKIMSPYEDRSAYMELAAALAFPDGKVFESVYQVPLKISDVIRGTKGNWDRVLMLPNDENSFSELPEDYHIDIWSENYKKIAKKLLEIEKSGGY